MRLLSIALTTLVVLWVWVITPAQAQQQRYISDELELPMRSGASTQFRIIRMLPSGTPVRLVDTDPASGYSRIRTEDGTLGFVHTRYLSTTPSLAQRLAETEAELANFLSENEHLQERLATIERLEQQVQTLSNDNQRLGHELSHLRTVSANAVALDERNQVLEEEVVNLERALQVATQENALLSDRRNQDWFVRGAGVLFVGLLAGLLLPRLRSRRSSRWGEL